jgi:acetyl esterase
MGIAEMKGSRNWTVRMQSIGALRVIVLLAISLTSAGCAEAQAADTAEPADSEPQVHTYRQVGGRSLRVYVFLPKTPASARPAILLFHGGAWRLGEAAWLFGRAKEFAEKGMVAISIEYRLALDGLSPIDGVEDACAAFAWTRQHAAKLGINPARVAGYGVSAGGHLVAAAATLPSVNGNPVAKSSRPNSLLLYSPALNMSHDKYFMSLMTGKGDPAAYSPSEFISRNLPPTLIIQGEKDTIVLTSDAIAFRDAAEKAGAKCELHVYPGVGHLLTRNLEVQYKDFRADPADQADAHRREDDFLASLGYLIK